MLVPQRQDIVGCCRSELAVRQLSHLPSSVATSCGRSRSRKESQVLWTCSNSASQISQLIHGYHPSIYTIRLATKCLDPPAPPTSLMTGPSSTPSAPPSWASPTAHQERASPPARPFRRLRTARKARTGAATRRTSCRGRSKVRGTGECKSRPSIYVTR